MAIRRNPLVKNWIFRFESQEDAEAGMAADGTMMNGKKLAVAFAKDERKSRRF